MWPNTPERLATRAAAGDRGAFRRLYRELYPQVRGYVLRRVRDEGDAEDVVAHVFHRMVEHIGDFDPDRGTVRAWVLTMARNAIVDRARRGGRVTGAADVDAMAHPDPGQDTQLARDDQARLVAEVLAEYPADVRRLFALRFGEGLKYREIATLVGASEAAIKQRFSRTLRELREKTTRREREGALGHAT